jgi:hypothetical protein
LTPGKEKMTLQGNEEELIKPESVAELNWTER